MDNRHLHGVTGKVNTNDIAVHNIDKHCQNDQQELNNKLSGGHDHHWFDTASHRNKEGSNVDIENQTKRTSQRHSQWQIDQ